VADETAAKKAVNTALMAAQVEYAELERTAVSMCQELEGDGVVSGSSVVSRLRALGGRISEHAKSTFRLGVLRAFSLGNGTGCSILSRTATFILCKNNVL